MVEDTVEHLNESATATVVTVMETPTQITILDAAMAECGIGSFGARQELVQLNQQQQHQPQLQHSQVLEEQQVQMLQPLELQQQEFVEHIEIVQGTSVFNFTFL